ncbi:hypothetical protein DFP73DRAFT_540116 [Morchella snyderi]|nr:hypothetical protein DFP73DRAFT_540116 [Morchella snyderi]
MVRGNFTTLLLFTTNPIQSNPIHQLATVPTTRDQRSANCHDGILVPPQNWQLIALAIGRGMGWYGIRNLTTCD